MHLTNFPKVRIQKYRQGYVVQIQKSRFGFKYWTHIESVAGIPSIPWVYSSFEIALSEVAKHFQCDIIDNSDNNE